MLRTIKNRESQIMKIETFSAEETYKIGEQMGREAKAGDVICLIGDLGVGKTVYDGLHLQNFCF